MSKRKVSELSYDTKRKQELLDTIKTIKENDEHNKKQLNSAMEELQEINSINNIINKIDLTVDKKNNGEAVIYARVSTKNQTTGTSIDSQLAECNKYCSDNNFKVVEKITEVVSARNINNQNKLLEFLYEYKDTHLIIYEPSRFSRNLKDGAEIIELCKKNNIIIHFVQPNLRTNNNNDMKDITSRIIDAQTELDTLSTRIKTSIAFRKKNNTYLSSIPKYGTQYIKTNNIRKVESNDMEESIIQVINLMYNGGKVSEVLYLLYKISGKKHTIYDTNNPDGELKTFEYGNMSFRSIADFLNSNDIFRRGKMWTSMSISQIANNDEIVV
jgi:DNA invertase Pin-like site-specific DNA recombinase